MTRNVTQSETEMRSVCPQQSTCPKDITTAEQLTQYIYGVGTGTGLPALQEHANTRPNNSGRARPCPLKDWAQELSKSSPASETLPPNPAWGGVQELNTDLSTGIQVQIITMQLYKPLWSQALHAWMCSRHATGNIRGVYIIISPFFYLSIPGAREWGSRAGKATLK